MFLGVDIGTSSVKAVLMADDGLITHQASTSLPISRPAPLQSEQAPEDWWTATETAVLALPAEARRQVRGGLVQLDMLRLAFPAGAFAGVWSDASLLHLPKPAAPGALAEMRRVLPPGGALFLALQEGAGEGWEAGRFGPVQRFFARYQPADVVALLGGAGFAVRRQGQMPAGPRTWLLFLATALYPPRPAAARPEKAG
jgi:SAM-dependent methyltransferase